MTFALPLAACMVSTMASMSARRSRVTESRRLSRVELSPSERRSLVPIITKKVSGVSVPVKVGPW